MGGAHLLTWAQAALATLCALAMTWMVGFEIIEDISSLVVASLLALLLALHIFYSTFRATPVLASIAGSMAAILWSMIMVAIISLAALGFHAPLIDDALISSDAAMGINVADIVTWTSHYPMFASALRMFYASSISLIFISAVALAVANQHKRLWRYCFSLLGSALACSLFSSLVPAIGAFRGLDIPASVVSRLPKGSGLYAVETFEAYRDGAMRTIDLGHMVAGVITFPSFHVAMALSAMYAFRTIRFCAWPAYLWNSLVIFSTIPIGGHYVTDLIAGALVWSALTLIARAAEPSLWAGELAGANSGWSAWLAPERRPRLSPAFVAKHLRRLCDEIPFYHSFNGSKHRLRN